MIIYSVFEKLEILKRHQGILYFYNAQNTRDVAKYLGLVIITREEFSKNKQDSYPGRHRNSLELSRITHSMAVTVNEKQKNVST